MAQRSTVQREPARGEGIPTEASSADVSLACRSDCALRFQREASSRKDDSTPQAECPSSLPTLPSDVVDRILDLVKEQWRARPQMRANDEVREWTQYSLVNKAWKAAFQDVCLCIVFSEMPSKQQVEWLRCTNAPVHRVTFLPSCTPCKSTASAFLSHARDLIRLCPGKTEPAPAPLPGCRIGAVA